MTKTEKRQARARREARAIPRTALPMLLDTHRELTGRKTRPKRFRISRDNALWSLLRSTGCRVSEACNARLSDLDLERGMLFVATSKNGASRYLPLNGATADLQAYLEARTRYGANGGHLFVSQKGERLSTGMARVIVNRLLEKALGDRAPRQSCHSLRHLRCSLWAREGIPPAVAAKVAGHSVQTYHRVYVRLDALDAAEIVAAHEAGKGT